MQYIKPISLKIKNFGPFLGEHTINFSSAGLTLFKGRVTETGDGSGAGKSYALNALSYLYGGCPFAGTELQSWYTEESPYVSGVLKIGDRTVTVTRHNGLQISGDGYEGKIKGRAAEAELNKLFGLSEEYRAIVTYRGQRTPGVFLNLSDSKKKELLSNLLDLDKYDSVAADAAEKADKLEQELKNLNVTKDALIVSLGTSEDSLKVANEELNSIGEYKGGNPEELKIQILEKQGLLKKERDSLEKIKRDDGQFLEAYTLKIRGRIKDINSRGEPAEVEWLQAKKSKLQSELSSLKEKDAAARLELEKTKAGYNNKIAELKRQDLLQQAEVDKKRADINKKISEFNVALSKEDRLKSDLEKAKVQEKHLSEQTCPTCKQVWIGDSAKLEMEACKHTQEKCAEYLGKIEKGKKAVAALKSSLSEIVDHQANPEILVLINKIRELEPHIIGFTQNPAIATTEQEIRVTAEQIKKEQAAFVDKKNKDIREIEAEETKFKTEFQKEFIEKTKAISNSIGELEESIRTLDASEKAALSVLSQKKVKEAIILERQSQVDNIKVKISKAEEHIEQKKAEFNLETDIAALFGKKGFLGVIFEDVLSEIAAVANDIISRVANVRHLTVDFETEKKAATSGNIATRITPVIYNRGRRVSFNAGISGGMQAAVELAIDLAWGDVVSRRRGSYPGWITLDETFHGLGGVAKESCLEMLQSYAGDRLVLVVDHSSEFQGLFHNVIEIEQTDGKSRIV